MNKFEAKQLLEDLLSCQKNLDRALEVAERIDVEAERDQLRKAIMSITADVYVETIRKIVLQYPELDPYKENKLTLVD